MYKIKYTNEMKRNVKAIIKRGKDIEKLISVLDTLSKGELLDPKYKDHQLSGKYYLFRECHIEPDWLLIYR